MKPYKAASLRINPRVAMVTNDKPVMEWSPGLTAGLACGLVFWLWIIWLFLY